MMTEGMNELTNERMNDMKKLMILVVMVAAFALPTMAQNFEAQQPNATFQSTSTMMGSGSSYMSNPTINEYGTASSPSYSPAQASGGPRRVIGTNPDGGEGSEDSPLGDAVLPLLLMALAFVGVITLRRKRKAADC